MSVIIESLLRDVIDSVYQPLATALIISFLFMYLYKSGNSLKDAISRWIHWFLEEKEFRKVFLCTFYIVLVLFRTILNRSGSVNPLSNLIGDWGFYRNAYGTYTLTAEPLENIILFIPLTFLLFWSLGSKVIAEDASFWKIISKAFLIGFLSSLAIESIQLICWIGTWQLSDLVNNTIGSIIGGILYWCLRRIHRDRE